MRHKQSKRTLELILVFLFTLTLGISVVGCQAVEKIKTRLTYYHYSVKGEDKKIKATVNGCLEAWGKARFREAYGYHSPTYKKNNTLADFLTRRQQIDKWLGAPVASFSITQVYIYPENPRKAEVLVIYRSEQGHILKDVVSLRKEGKDWKIVDWWVKR